MLKYTSTMILPFAVSWGGSPADPEFSEISPEGKAEFTEFL